MDHKRVRPRRKAKPPQTQSSHVRAIDSSSHGGMGWSAETNLQDRFQTISSQHSDLSYPAPGQNHRAMPPPEDQNSVPRVPGLSYQPDPHAQFPTLYHFHHQTQAPAYHKPSRIAQTSFPSYMPVRSFFFPDSGTCILPSSNSGLQSGRLLSSHWTTTSQIRPMQGSNNFIHSNSFKQQQSGNQFSVTDDPAVKPLTNDERRTTNNATKNAKKSPRGWNRPSPTKSYLSRARAEPTLLQEPQRLLVILDLNGVLVHRKKSRTGHVERPDLKVFLDYLFANHYVMVWSSGMPGNVTAICDKIFTPKQRKALVGVWGRDTLRLPTSLFREKVQVYKQLAWVWQDQAVKAKVLSSELPIDAEHMPGFNQGNTVLIDDSAEKAASEPHNLIEVDEFGGRPDEMQGTVLSQVVEYLEKARCAEDVSSWMREQPFGCSLPIRSLKPESGRCEIEKTSVHGCASHSLAADPSDDCIQGLVNAGLGATTE